MLIPLDHCNLPTGRGAASISKEGLDAVDHCDQGLITRGGLPWVIIFLTILPKGINFMSTACTGSFIEWAKVDLKKVPHIVSEDGSIDTDGDFRFYDEFLAEGDAPPKANPRSIQCQLQRLREDD